MPQSMVWMTRSQVSHIVDLVNKVPRKAEALCLTEQAIDYEGAGNAVCSLTMCSANIK